MNDQEFRTAFENLTGNEPFPWQEALYEHFLDANFRSPCCLPTGLGKTAILAIWLIALANKPRKIPRRLVYIVNRRTVVDQATDEARRLRERLTDVPEILNSLQSLSVVASNIPLAISSLRGQFADNGEWRDDPARPAIIVGTVDMIGSRLLFSGYRCGYKSKPTHAGLLGQDALIVHDEAHLEPAFQQLLESICKQQNQDGDSGCIKVIELTATARGEADVFGLTEAEKTPAEITSDTPEPLQTVWKRITAKKGIKFHSPESEKEKVADRIGKLAKKYSESHPGSAVLVFVNSLKSHAIVCKALQGEQVQMLTGTLRGLERDRMADPRKKTGCPIFARFLKPPRPKDGETEQWKITPTPGTVYLVCTSAGEVGVNISADHLICDLTPFDSMAQRFGRVNRFGEGNAIIDVVHEAEIDPTKNEYEDRRLKTLTLLKKLPQRKDGRHDASPKALDDLPADQRRAAFTPEPVILHVDDILFDAWALTTIRDELPGRPSVADWLHGKPDRDLPETHVAWRKEVERITEEWLETHSPNDLLEDYPLKPHELLRDNTDRVLEHLKKLSAEHAEKPVWVVSDRDDVRPTTLGGIIKDGKESIQHKTILLPPSVGGLEKGLLNGSAKYDSNRQDEYHYDVADEWRDQHGPLRLRYFKKGELEEDDRSFVNAMRRVRDIDFTPSEEDAIAGEDAEPCIWHWRERPRSADPSWKAHHEQLLTDHLKSAEEFALQIVGKVGLDEPLRSAIVIAAKYHDLGKHRQLWQNGIGNRDYPSKVLAKSNHWRRPNHRYRHEFGSLIDITEQPDFKAHPAEMQELILHLIAAHHGRGRPHFPEREAFDPEDSKDESQSLSVDVPRRFARLQRRYGRWGLAWLESLVRAADVMASQATEDTE